MRIIAISDTHTQHRNLKKLPIGDVLIHAGDFMGSGYRHQEVKDFADWFSSQSSKHKILVAGNHDRMLEADEKWCLSKFSPDVIYLKDSGVTIDSVKFWGSPYQPEFREWAFNVSRGYLHKHWDLIPSDIDVLITHGPSYGVLDKMYEDSKEHLGCPELPERISKLNIKSLTHIFGHIHGGSGHILNGNVDSYNVAQCDEQYIIHNRPAVIDL